MDDVLKEELGPIYIGLRDFHDTYFGGVADLEPAAEAFFEQCLEGSSCTFGVELLDPASPRLFALLLHRRRNAQARRAKEP